MSDSQETYALARSFDMRGYVNATNDAARRTRTVTIVLVVASVLIGIGWYNSVRWSWELHRLRQAYNANDDSICRFLDCANHPLLKVPEDDGRSPLSKFREQIRQDTVKAYVENVRFIRAPFFGIAFDVNDLGVIGGVALIMILLVMRYSLSREIKNLNVSLREAMYHDRLPAFYHAVAMRQVFTVPHMKGEKKNQWLAAAPRVICILPVFVFFLGVTYDFYSAVGLRVYLFREVQPTLLIETIWLILIVYLAARCWERQSHIDDVWEQHWNRLSGLKSSVIRLSKDLIQEFGSDDEVNGALRRFRSEAWDANKPF